MENVLVTVTVNGIGSSEISNYGSNVSYNLLKATLKDKYPRLESFELINSSNIICHPSDVSLSGGNYVVNITIMQRKYCSFTLLQLPNDLTLCLLIILYNISSLLCFPFPSIYL